MKYWEKAAGLCGCLLLCGCRFRPGETAGADVPLDILFSSVGMPREAADLTSGR